MPLQEINQNDQGVVDKDSPKNTHHRKRRASEGSVTMSSHWKKRCASLKHERTEATERQIYGIMEESGNREESLKVYIRHLESDLRQANQVKKLAEKQAQQILSLQDELQDARLKTKETKDELKKIQEENITLLDKVQNQATHLGHYKFITATHFTAIEDGLVECCITNSSERSTTKFQFEKTDNEGIMKFTPVENIDILPKFLQQPIIFETKACPELIRHVLKKMFPAE